MPAGAHVPRHSELLGESRWRQYLLPAAVLIALTFAAFSPVLQAGFVWDDDAYVTENPNLHDLSGLRDIWFDIGATKMYVPLTFTTLWAEHQLWGNRPLGYHLVNLALHAAGAVLFWLLLLRLGLPGAWLAAAVFAVHPVFVESVAWVTEIKNTQSTVFALLCCLAYRRFALSSAAEGPGRHPWIHYSLTLFAFAAALASKPVVVALPLVLLLLLWWKRGFVGRGDIAAIAPMLLLSLAAGLVAMHVERIYGGARGVHWQLPLLDRILVAGRALWFYVGKLLWPTDLAPIYPRWSIDPAFPAAYLFPLAAGGALAALWLYRTRIGRGPFVAAATFGLLVAPLIGIFNVSYHLNSYVADHFQHHAAPALIALLAAGATGLARRFPRVGRSAPWLAALILAALALSSNVYARVFESEETRCRATLERNPSSWLAMNNLGVALNRQRKFAEAKGWFEKAIVARQPYPEAESNLGVALVGLGNPVAAIEHYRTSLRAWPENPLAHNNLGTALAQTGRIGAAEAEFEEALRLRPDYAEPRANLDKLRSANAQASDPLASERTDGHSFETAIEELLQEVRSHPDSAERRNNLGAALASSGDLDAAIEQFSAAARLMPDSVASRINLGNALLSSDRPAAALDPLEEAVRLAPHDGQAHHLLGVCLAQLDRLPEALHHFEEALRIDPTDREAGENLQRAREALVARIR
ncbi:MAG: tetratricopeptide repeat protein [Thermoanaerobaculia bacterium]